MTIPKTIDEANALGLPQEGSFMKYPPYMGGVYHDDAAVGYLCYQGPCVNGKRTICYRTDFGCDDCRSTEDGCE